jgi:hypothetical protein
MPAGEGLIGRAAAPGCSAGRSGSWSGEDWGVARSPTRSKSPRASSPSGGTGASSRSPTACFGRGRSGRRGQWPPGVAERNRGRSPEGLAARHPAGPDSHRRTHAGALGRSHVLRHAVMRPDPLGLVHPFPFTPVPPPGATRGRSLSSWQRRAGRAQPKLVARSVSPWAMRRSACLWRGTEPSLMTTRRRRQQANRPRRCRAATNSKRSGRRRSLHRPPGAGHERVFRIPRVDEQRWHHRGLGPGDAVVVDHRIGSCGDRRYVARGPLAHRSASRNSPDLSHSSKPHPHASACSISRLRRSAATIEQPKAARRHRSRTRRPRRDASTSGSGGVSAASSLLNKPQVTATGSA